MYFKKLNRRILGAPVPAVLDDIIKYGYTKNLEFKGIKYSKPSALHLDKYFDLIDLLPDEVSHLFNISVMSINARVNPHTDSNTATAINFYVDAGNYVTTFHNIKEDAPAFQLNTQTDGVVYNFKDVDDEASFVAETGDIYVLDVTKTHSVRPLTKPADKRISLTLSTMLEYDSVIEMLQDDPAPCTMDDDEYDSAIRTEAWLRENYEANNS